MVALWDLHLQHTIVMMISTTPSRTAPTLLCSSTPQFSERHQDRHSRQRNGCYHRMAYSAIGHSGTAPFACLQSPSCHPPAETARDIKPAASPTNNAERGGTASIRNWLSLRTSDWMGESATSACCVLVCIMYLSV